MKYFFFLTVVYEPTHFYPIYQTAENNVCHMEENHSTSLIYCLFFSLHGILKTTKFLIHVKKRTFTIKSK